MPRIIFTQDFLYHAAEHKPTYHTWVADLIAPAIELATGEKINLFAEQCDSEGNVFDRNHFFGLSGITNVKLAYFSYDINAISAKSWEYLLRFINPDDFIIGIELGLELRQKLSEFGIKCINFWFHSYHLFDDTCFMLNTNDEKLFSKLLKYQIPKQKFDLYTNIAKKRLSREADNLHLEDDACLFVGQTLTDKSVDKDGVFLNITHFSDKLNQLKKQYSVIYYAPHPYCGLDENQDIKDFVESRPFIRVLQNIPTYTLLASNEIKKVVAISSSVVYEAKFFGKDTEYLYKPLFIIDGEFGLNTFISIYNDYLNPAFWCDIFEGIFNINKDAWMQKLFDFSPNTIRYVSDSWHGYRYLHPESVLREKISNLDNNLHSIQQQMENNINSIYQDIQNVNQDLREHSHGPVFAHTAENLTKDNYKE